MILSPLLYVFKLEAYGCNLRSIMNACLYKVLALFKILHLRRLIKGCAYSNKPWGPNFAISLEFTRKKVHMTDCTGVG